MKITSTKLAEILSLICGRELTVVKAPDDESDDEVHINDQTHVQVGGYYAIVMRKVHGRMMTHDVHSLYDLIKTVERLDNEALVPPAHVLQF